MPGKISHGYSHTATYHIWALMKLRCNNVNDCNYKNYGGRGIKLCERWNLFENFLEDMGERPSPNHSIDRWPDKNGNYEPGNCRWATSKEQCRNTNYNHMVTLDGITLCFSDMAKHFGIPKVTAQRRFHMGWPYDCVFKLPVRKYRR